MLTIKENLNEKQKAQLVKINKAIDDMAKDRDVVAWVNKTESGLKTTKGNYGKYMQFLTPYSKDDIMLYIMKEALILAGADVFGVNSAIRVLKGV